MTARTVPDTEQFMVIDYMEMIKLVTSTVTALLYTFNIICYMIGLMLFYG